MQMQVWNKSITLQKNITRQVLQSTVPIKVVDLILELRNAIVSRENEMVHAMAQLEFGENEDPIIEPLLLGDQVIGPMLLIVNMPKKPTVVNMEILGRNLANTIVDGGFGVNILLENT